MAEEDFLRGLHAGVEVLKSQQSEINRRLGLIEKKLQDDDAEADESRVNWKTWALQTIGQVLVVTALVALGNTIGVDLKW
jgi:hypothetical protein